jgi:predicted Zn-dependent protease
MKYGSVRDGDAQFAVDKLTPNCQGVPLSTDAFNRESHQLQTEWTTGNQLAEKVEQDATLIEDPGLTAYVNSLERTIMRHSDLHGCFIVKILDDPEANAFSLPGGFLYVTSGLLLIVDSEGELTAALAHESGHVTAHHFARIGQKRRLWGRVVLAGGPAGYLVRRLVGPLLTRKLIRNSEFEADRLSLQYQSASGYDPSELIRLLHNVFQDQGKPPSFLERLFDTHPLTSTRIRRLDKAKHRLPQRNINQPVDTRRFQQAKERLAALLKLAIPDSSLPKTHQ